MCAHFTLGSRKKKGLPFPHWSGARLTCICAFYSSAIATAGDVGAALAMALAPLMENLPRQQECVSRHGRDGLPLRRRRRRRRCSDVVELAKQRSHRGGFGTFRSTVTQRIVSRLSHCKERCIIAKFCRACSPISTVCLVTLGALLVPSSGAEREGMVG